MRRRSWRVSSNAIEHGMHTALGKMSDNLGQKPLAAVSAWRCISRADAGGRVQGGPPGSHARRLGPASASCQLPCRKAASGRRPWRAPPAAALVLVPAPPGSTAQPHPLVSPPISLTMLLLRYPAPTPGCNTYMVWNAMEQASKHWAAMGLALSPAPSGLCTYASSCSDIWSGLPRLIAADLISDTSCLTWHSQQHDLHRIKTSRHNACFEGMPFISQLLFWVSCTPQAKVETCP